MPQLGSNLSGLSNTAIMEERSQRLLMMILMIPGNYLFEVTPCSQYLD
jgi:hypothetical protein